MSDSAPEAWQNWPLPPLAMLQGIKLDGMHQGAPRISIPYQDVLQGRPGLLHGGAIAGFLEAAALLGLRAMLESEGANRSFKPVNITVSYMRSGKPTTSYGSSVVTKFGRTVANVDAFVWQDDPSSPYARASLHYLMAEA